MPEWDSYHNRKVTTLVCHPYHPSVHICLICQGVLGIPDLGDVPMEAAILVHVHPLGPSFRPGGGQALPLPTVNLLTLFSLLLMIAL